MFYHHLHGAKVALKTMWSPSGMRPFHRGPDSKFIAHGSSNFASTVFPSVTPTQSKNPLWWFDLTNQWCMCNHCFWCAPSSFSLGFDIFFCRMKQRSAQRCKVSPLSQTWLYTGREIAFKMRSFFCRWCSSLSSAGPVLKMQQLQAVVHSGALMLPSLEKLVFLPLLLSMRSGVVDEL